MAIFGSVFALLGRFAGRVLNSALGWATLLLFGKVQGRNQSVLLAIVLGSLIWVLAIIGVLIPDVGVFLLAFVPVPDFIDENVVRRVAVARARAAIATQLTKSPAYMTASAESERIEDELRTLLEDASVRGAPNSARVRERLARIDQRIANLTVPFDEWETVYRERLQVERDALLGRLDETTTADEAAGPVPASRRPGFVEWAFGGVGMALLIVDVLLLLRARSASTRRF